MILQFLAGIGIYLLSIILFRIFVERRETNLHASTPVAKGWNDHNTDVASVTESFRSFLSARRAGDATVSLVRSRDGHTDSNRTMVASYKSGGATRIDVSALVRVVAIDETRKDGVAICHVEPGIAQDELARFCLAHGYVPQVVLEFPGITAGGALAGGGIESSSHKAGSFADTVEDVDVLTGTGELLKGVSRTFHPHLFAALRTSYGSIGLVLRIGIRIERAHKYVLVRYVHAASLADACDIMTAESDKGADAPDFIDAVSLSLDSTIVVLGTAVDTPPDDVPTLSLRGARADKWFFWHLAEIAAVSLPLTAKTAVASKWLSSHSSTPIFIIVLR